MRSLSSWTQIVQNDHKKAEVEKLYAQISDQPAVIERVVRHQPEFAPASISIRDLAFHGTKDRVVFENINLDIASGQFVGMKGADGSGRSVLLRSLMGDIAPTHGEISINGMAPRDARHLISYVGQVPQVFRGSILDNLTLFGTYTAQDAKWVADLSGLSSEIHRLPDGFDTQLLGSANPELSTAFSQLICIARAVVSKPSVLLLDASNNGLDAKTESSFAHMLQHLSGKMTIILATQRPSLLRQADAVFELSNKSGMLMAKSKATSPDLLIHGRAS